MAELGTIVRLHLLVILLRVSIVFAQPRRAVNTAHIHRSLRDRPPPGLAPKHTVHSASIWRRPSFVGIGENRVVCHEVVRRSSSEKTVKRAVHSVSNAELRN